MDPNHTASSCYDSMTASTSDDPTIERKMSEEAYIDAPSFLYDVDTDFNDLKSTQFLQDSGYQSVMDRLHNPLSTSLVCTDDISLNGEDSLDDQWDGFLTVGVDRCKIKDMSDILASRYAFLSGARTNEGLTIVTFPDSRAQLSFDDYQLLITYLLQVPALEESHKGFVLIIDRRNDKWTSVRTALMNVSAFFPGYIRVVLLLKPEGVLQRALEVGYRGIAENCAFKVILCESSLDLRRFLRAEQLTMDVGGLIKYNHLEWVQHRMDIERMKSSATVIAQSLADFGRTLRETELPNDAETTARILQIQTSERDAIKEDFRISARKGLALLRTVRQLEQKPKAEQLSPTRLHNVTSIERMLVQLEETEKSFDTFWAKHEKRLMNCLQLRQFEDSFRKLQSSFARHMLYLEEHREVGDGAEGAELLAKQHQEYSSQAMDDVKTARSLKETGEELISSNDVELSASLLPKCEELERMADALTGALERRAKVLEMSRTMHSQIQMANLWCKKGVEILTSLPNEMSPTLAANGLLKMDEFLDEGSKLQLDALSQSPSINSMILLTTTETSSLLAQVAERIDDIRRMSVARRDVLAKAAAESKKPVQVVTPEKVKRIEDSVPSRELEDDNTGRMMCSADVPSVSSSPQSSHSMSIERFVLSELLTTEKNYVAELESIIENYMDPFDSPENQSILAPAIRAHPELVFGNLRELHHFHSRFVLPQLNANENSLSGICRTFLQQKHRYLALYHMYCQNKSTTEQIRKEYVDNSPFFAECQQKANHLLPLSAYLLKPVQRITKYQLLLRELERHCRPEIRPEVSSTLTTMLDLLAQINAAIHQLHISGFNSDLRLLGALRLQSECDVFTYNRKKKTKVTRAQRRHLFLFDGGLLFCKKRSPPNSQPSQMDPEYFEHKMCIPTSSLGFSDTSKTASNRFEVWDDAKSEAFAIDTLESGHRERWVNRLQVRFSSDLDYHRMDMDRQRPKSWASTASNDSSFSSSTRTSDESSNMMDTNGNTQTATLFESPTTMSPLHSPTSTLDTSGESDHVVPHTPIVPISESLSSNLVELNEEEIELVEDV
ncbi:unnamed protein product [Auanema sp. JU1783]|nr:unnamed protein product [Auanema sp. JU1783]